MKEERRGEENVVAKSIILRGRESESESGSGSGSGSESEIQTWKRR